MIYLDWAATAKPKKKIITEMLNESLIYYGNPSSVHSAGLKSKEAMEENRVKCSKLLGCNPEELYFTSGGSESNDIALLSFLNRHINGEIITTSIEHPSILEPVNTLKKFGWKIKNINPGTDGLIPLKKIKKSITENTKIISLIYVHNETGVIQPLSSIVELIRKEERELGKKIHIHIDGVQALCKIKIDLRSLNIDSFSVSGHKFGAPKGVGLLYLSKFKEVLIRGGGQEKGIRPGTENLFGIMALTNCLNESLKNFDETYKHLDLLMNKLITGVRQIGAYTIPKNRSFSDDNFVPNILSLTFPPLPGEVIARVLNSKGFMISTGSACSSNKKSTTLGILSMGITRDEGFSSFRVSIGHSTSAGDIENFLKALEETTNELAP